MEKITSDYFLKFIKDKLKIYFENIDFDMNFHQDATVFYVQDVEIRKDLLKKLGIPLELAHGKIQEIKITIKNLITNPIKFEIQGVHLEFRTIYLSREYKQGYKTFKQKFLDEWEKLHRAVFKIQNSSKSKEDSLMESIMITRICQTEFSISDIRIIITDNLTNITEKNKNKNLELRIESIKSNSAKEESVNVKSVEEIKNKDISLGVDVNKL
jgi:hypothetical protein